MNTTDAPTVAPEVQEFLTAVRAQLADLEPEEQREILDGLEADLTDLIIETLALAIDLYPRAPGESVEALGLKPDVVEDHPFAALKALKPKDK